MIRANLQFQKTVENGREYRCDTSPMDLAYPRTQTMREYNHSDAKKKVATGNSNPEKRTDKKYPGRVSSICWWDRWTQLKARACLLVPSVVLILFLIHGNYRCGWQRRNGKNEARRNVTVRWMFFCFCFDAIFDIDYHYHCSITLINSRA